MSSGSRKRKKQQREEELSRKRQLNEASQKNPSGGSRYAKKADKPFEERVAAEMERRIQDQQRQVGLPVDEREDLLLVGRWEDSAFGLYDMPEAGEADLMRQIEERVEARQNEGTSSRRRTVFDDFDYNG